MQRHLIVTLEDILFCFFASAGTYWFGEPEISCGSERSSCIIDGKDYSKIEFAIWFVSMPWCWNLSDRCEIIVLVIITNSYYCCTESCSPPREETRRATAAGETAEALHTCRPMFPFKGCCQDGGGACDAILLDRRNAVSHHTKHSHVAFIYAFLRKAELSTVG
jgi:hypothetical protein